MPSSALFQVSALRHCRLTILWYFFRQLRTFVNFNIRLLKFARKRHETICSNIKSSSFYYLAPYCIFHASIEKNLNVISFNILLWRRDSKLFLFSSAYYSSLTRREAYSYEVSYGYQFHHLGWYLGLNLFWNVF